jgi:hypothetical protein
MSKTTCIKCDKPADKVYKPDLDLKGIGMCNEHEKEVTIDIIASQINEDGWKRFEKKYLKKKK